MKVLTPPESIWNYATNSKLVFLAGTIDLGNSEDWQSKVIEHYKNQNVTIYNPRRKNWDASWEQRKTNPEFRKQVDWELDALRQSDMIIFNFLPESKSPISLLELGLYHDKDKLYVCCPDEFYRSGNVHIVCDRLNIPVFQNMEELLKNL